MEETMAAQSLSKALARKRRKKDKFSTGAVIRWMKGTYTYAALKTPAGWYTTSAYDRSVPKVLTYEDLLEILSSERVTDVQVATGWEAV